MFWVWEHLNALAPLQKDWMSSLSPTSANLHLTFWHHLEALVGCKHPQNEQKTQAVGMLTHFFGSLTWLLWPTASCRYWVGHGQKGCQLAVASQLARSFTQSVVKWTGEAKQHVSSSKDAGKNTLEATLAKGTLLTMFLFAKIGFKCWIHMVYPHFP